ncbi:MAG: (2Fe-2S)-binding protein, partial [Planctomycetes bacterium]|nr:(2Fe-2S)-binding protein [Planctomycetota bacterium]
MPSLTIDGRPADVPPGSTILDAARAAGIEIPTLCFRDGLEPATSCMVCVVKVKDPDRIVPSCVALAEEGLVVESETDEIRELRRTALELLLSDHLGDCVAPCEAVCPASLRIPKMLRRIRAARFDEALAIAREDLVLPATLGRVCPAPCEKGCRRGTIDDGVAIPMLHRFVADRDLAKGPGWLPERAPESGKRIAIVGAGPAGLAAAYALLACGHACTVFDERDEPGGMLREAIDPSRLPRRVLRAEIGCIEGLGAELRLRARVGESVSIDELRSGFDAVAIAIGEAEAGAVERLGLVPSKGGIEADRETYATRLPGVFAGGGALRKLRMAVRAVADGKAMAASIARFLAGEEARGRTKRLSVHIGRMDAEEARGFLREASDGPRVAAGRGSAAGYEAEEATAEAARCLHCDCRKPESCALRRWAEIYGAQVNRWKGEGRRRFVQREGAHVLFEPGKCIDCGICVRIAEAAREPLGLTFVGRGFDVRVGIPFDASLA